MSSSLAKSDTQKSENRRQFISKFIRPLKKKQLFVAVIVNIRGKAPKVTL